MSCVAWVVVPSDETGVTTRITTESLAYPSLTVVSPKLLFSASPAKPCWRSHVSMFTASSELADFAIMTTPERVNFVGLLWPLATYQSKLCGTAMENLRLLFVFRSLRSCRAGPIFTAGAFVSPCRPPWPSMYHATPAATISTARKTTSTLIAIFIQQNPHSVVKWMVHCTTSDAASTLEKR